MEDLERDFKSRFKLPKKPSSSFYKISLSNIDKLIYYTGDFELSKPLGYFDLLDPYNYSLLTNPIIRSIERVFMCIIRKRKVINTKITNTYCIYGPANNLMICEHFLKYVYLTSYYHYKKLLINNYCYESRVINRKLYLMPLSEKLSNISDTYFNEDPDYKEKITTYLLNRNLDVDRR